MIRGHRFDLREKRRRARRRRIVLGLMIWLLTSVSGAMGAAWFLNHPALRLQSLRLVGARTINADQVQAALAPTLGARFLGLFRQDSVIFLPRRLLAEILRRDFGQLASVALTPGLDRTLRVQVSERRPVAVWCRPGETPCAYLDLTGYPYVTAPRFLGRPLLTIVKPQSPGTAELAALRHQIDLLLGTLRASEGTSFRISSAEWLSLNDIRLTLEGQVGINYRSVFLLINLTKSAETTAENLLSAFENKEFATEFTARWGELEYLDLRFDDKIFYKFQENLL